MILRLLNAQGIAGLVAGACLALLLIIQKVETRHWKVESAKLERNLEAEKTRLAATIANYRQASDTARAADRANAQRVASEQQAVNERTAHDFETRLAAARAAAAALQSERLRLDREAAANSSVGGDASLSRLPAPARGPAHAASPDGLPLADRLLATEQAIQLDELIRWVRAQAAIDPNGQARD
jgi:hypothetical protein